MKVAIIIAVLLVGLLVFASSSSETNTNTAESVKDFNSLVGTKIPDFSLPDLNGDMVSTADLRGKKIVMFFNEGVMCYPACWNQIAALGTDPYFNSDNIVSLNIEPDSRFQWEEAVRQMPELGMSTMLFDSDLKVTKSFNFQNLTSSMHKGKLAGHTFVVVDEEGVIRYVYDDPDMAIRNDLLKQELEKF